MISRDYQKVFKDGLCVCVHVGGWDGAMLLSPEDLGLKSENVVNAIELGKKMLVPKEEIHEFRYIEGQARNIVDKNSFVFPIGNSKFVPRRKFKEVVTRLTELQSQYNVLAENLVATYPELQAQMLPVYKEAAEKAFETLNPAVLEFGGVEDPEQLRIKREEEKSEYVGKFLERIISSYPAVETLRRRFYLTWDVYQTAAPEMLLTTVDDVLQTTEAQRDAAEEAHRQMSAKIESFVSDVVTSLRGETSKLCSKIATAVKSGKVIRSSTIDSLKNHIERFKDMNFVGDQTVQAQLEAVQKELLDLNPTENFQTDSNLREELATRLSSIAESASKVTEQDVGSVTSQYRRMVNWQ
jgi:hypothetical protein